MLMSRDGSDGSEAWSCFKGNRRSLHVECPESIVAGENCELQSGERSYG